LGFDLEAGGGGFAFSFGGVGAEARDELVERDSGRDLEHHADLVCPRGGVAGVDDEAEAWVRRRHFPGLGALCLVYLSL